MQHAAAQIANELLCTLAAVSREQNAKAATQSFLSALLADDSDSKSDGDGELPSLDGWFEEDGQGGWGEDPMAA